MTVCIAAQCIAPGGRPCFVICTDARIEDDTSGGDVALKIAPDSHNWVHLIAGNVARAQELMAVHTDAACTGGLESEAEALSAFRVAPAKMKERLVREYLSTHWAISLEEFRQIGPDHYPADVYGRIHLDIEQVNIGCEIIAAGFAGRVPVLCLTNQLGEVKPHSGFVTAGSGYLLAQASLFQRSYRMFTPVDVALYCVYEAKKIAESAPGVGDTTHMAIFGPLKDLGGGVMNASINFLSPNGLHELEKYRKMFGPREVAIGATDIRKYLLVPSSWE